jgi:hypothetical protein
MLIANFENIDLDSLGFKFSVHVKVMFLDYIQ